MSVMMQASWTGTREFSTYLAGIAPLMKRAVHEEMVAIAVDVRNKALSGIQNTQRRHERPVNHKGVPYYPSMPGHPPGTMDGGFWKSIIMDVKSDYVEIGSVGLQYPAIWELRDDDQKRPWLAPAYADINFNDRLANAITRMPK